MAYLIYIGNNENNINGLSSKGYHIIRKGCNVVYTYGAVEVSGRNKKRITWCKGYQEKVQPCKDIEAANKCKHEKIKRRLWNGYERIDSKIYKR